MGWIMTSCFILPWETHGRRYHCPKCSEPSRKCECPPLKYKLNNDGTIDGVAVVKPSDFNKST